MLITNFTIHSIKFNRSYSAELFTINFIKVNNESVSWLFHFICEIYALFNWIIPLQWYSTDLLSKIFWIPLQLNYSLKLKNKFYWYIGISWGRTRRDELRQSSHLLCFWRFLGGEIVCGLKYIFLRSSKLWF